MQRNDIPSLQDAIRAMHQCDAHHVRSVPVRETAGDKVAWEGVVDVFDLPSCAAGARCYAWSERDGMRTKPVIVLETPSVTSPQRAVQAALARR